MSLTVTVINQVVPTQTVSQMASNPIFNAETSDSFEFGLKKDFPEQNFRINAAAHYTTVEDFQANTFTGNGFNLQNAGEIEISGLELEATWVPMDTMEVNFTYAKVDYRV